MVTIVTVKLLVKVPLSHIIKKTAKCERLFRLAGYYRVDNKQIVNTLVRLRDQVTKKHSLIVSYYKSC